MSLTSPLEPTELAQSSNGFKQMNQSARLHEILELLEVNSSCSITELALRFAVSEETIRRDVRALENSGRVRKVHGGVRLPDNVFEAAYHQRINENGALKRIIGLKAAELVKDGMTLLIDSGSSTYWLAKALKARNLTIITNAIEVAREMTGRNNARVYFAGGEIFDNYCSCFGAETQTFMQRFTPEIAFFSIGAIESQRGLLDYFLPEAELKRAIAPLARKVVVLVDSTKFERHGLIRTLDFKDIHVLITDADPGAELRKVMDGVEIQIATPSN
jgi:DeoR family transcriptional regulator, glycerol-3-phosphate regulon repressor